MVASSDKTNMSQHNPYIESEHVDCAILFLKSLLCLSVEYNERKERFLMADVLTVQNHVVEKI